MGCINDGNECEESLWHFADACCHLNYENYRNFLHYDRITDKWTHKISTNDWEPKFLELHESSNSTVETEINHPGLIKE